MWAVAGGYTETVTALAAGALHYAWPRRERGSCGTAVDGNTAFMLAVLKGHTETGAALALLLVATPLASM